MLRTLNELQDYSIRASDGDIGRIDDFLFDDTAWVIRYLVVETGSWLASRRILLSPMSITQPNWIERVLPVSISRERVRHSPDIDTALPVSEQQETATLGYYGYPYYWGGIGLWGATLYPDVLAIPGFTPGASREPGTSRGSPSASGRTGEQVPQARHALRSCRAVTGYHIHAKDGDIGHVQGLLVDEETWAIRYMIVNTSNWWMGHQVLVSPSWIEGFDWFERTASVDLTRKMISSAPAYDPKVTLEREFERKVHHHLGRSPYWESETIRHAGHAHAD